MDLTSKPLPSQEEMYDLYMHPKDKFENEFYVGVISTGVFNTAHCLSKKPKKENMLFFSSTKEALDYGYRPCMNCRPMNMENETPGFIADLIDEVDHNPLQKISGADLVERGIDASSVTQWFQKHHKISFQAYLRYQRINHLFGNIMVDNHPKVHRSYHLNEVVHGVNESENLEEKSKIMINRIDTPIGPMLAGVSDNGLCLLEFSDRRILENQLEVIEKYFDAVLCPGENELFDQLQKEMNEYFEGERKEFDVPIAFPGSPFQENVWNSLMEIPYGQTRSYKEQSIYLKNPKAIRAMAHANGENRISIVVPCHRIIGSKGDLVGYGGGLWRKKYLLDLENPSQISLEF